MEKDYLMKEFELFDGDKFITFNVYDLNLARNVITVATTSDGRISVQTFDLQQDELGCFFEYGYWFPQRIYVEDFQ